MFLTNTEITSLLDSGSVNNLGNNYGFTEGQLLSNNPNSQQPIIELSSPSVESGIELPDPSVESGIELPDPSVESGIELPDPSVESGIEDIEISDEDNDFLLSPQKSSNTLNSYQNPEDIELNKAREIIYGNTTDNNKNYYYRFTVEDDILFNLRLNNFGNSNADLKLLQNNNNVIAKSDNSRNLTERITAELTNGTYYIQVFSQQDAQYKLVLESDNIQNPGNNSNTAKDLRLLKNWNSERGWVGNGDPIDYYKFGISKDSDLTINLANLSNDARLDLYDSRNRLLLTSNNPNSEGETIEAELTRGEYYVSVSSNQNTMYQLLMKKRNIFEPGESINEAQNLHNIGKNTRRTREGWVGSTDLQDFYQIIVPKELHLDIELDNLSDNADLRLYDTTGRPIETSRKSGTNTETISTKNSIGNYYIEVFTNRPSVDYRLKVSGTEERSSNQPPSSSPVDLVVEEINYSLNDLRKRAFDPITGYGLVDASDAVAKALERRPLREQPNLGGNSWHLDMMNVPDVWAAGYTGRGVTVAVIDSGIDRNHQELRNNLWVNTGEIPNNGIDDDRNGYVDDVNGWNFIAHNGTLSDSNSHGTHVSGIVAAQDDPSISNRTEEVIGVAPNANIMPLNVFGNNRGASISSITEAINYAVDNGAQVINISLGILGDQYSSFFTSVKNAITRAARNDVVVVMSAGNDRGNPTTSFYPATFATEAGIAVGSLDQNSQISNFSNHSGQGAEDLYYVTAPGRNIISAIPGNNRTGSKSGTSMAAPAVAGVVALMLDANEDLSEQQVRDILISR